MEVDGTPPMPWEASRDWPQTRAEFESLIKQYQGPLVRYAFRRLGHIQDAEDAVQEVFARLHSGTGRPAHIECA